jgi:mannose-6-phosphate isomerase-like protein (cupin superfamily)
MSIREAQGYALGPDDGDTTWFLGGLLTWKASAKQTAGQYDLAEQLGRQGFMAPLHTHERESEGFYVLEGEVRVVLGDRTLTVTAGSFAFVPPRVRHAFRVISPQAKMLVIVAPAGLRAFFEEMGEPATSPSLPPPQEGPPDLRRLEERAAAYGITLLGPPPSEGE